MSSRWRDAAFLADAEAWIGAAVAPTGPLDQFHVRPWSTVIRVPTADGDLFFKANEGAFAHEVVLVERLAPLAPDLLPEVVAADRRRGWLLLRDAGVRLRDRPDPTVWRRLLPRYADVQGASAGLVDELVSAGVPDRRLRELPGLYESLGGDRGVAEELCAEVAALGLPETAEHSDLHDNQVFVGASAERLRILDWGDACVGPPLATLAVTGQLADAAAVDAYLARWGDPHRLRAAVPAVRRLGGISRAATWATVIELADADWRERFAAGLPEWIRRVATPPEAWADGVA